MIIPVNFSLRSRRQLLQEETLWADLAAARVSLIDNENLEGAIRLSLPAGEVCVEDDLHAAIQNLCLLPILRLLDGRRATYVYYSCAGELNLTPVGDEIELTGDFINEIRAPLRPLVDGLLACGERFVRWLRMIDVPEHADTLAHLEGHLQAALTVARLSPIQPRVP